MKRCPFILSALLALVATAFGQVVPPDAVPETLIVQHRKGGDRPLAHRTFALHGASLEEESTALEFATIHVPEGKLEKVRKALEKSGQFTFVERDFLARASLLPNDPSYGTQWHLPQVQAPAAWDLNTGSTFVPIAMIDSGVDPTHPDLAGRLAGGWSFLTGTSNTADVEGHGTATAGLLAMTDNSNGIAGVNWKSPIVPLVVLDSTGYARYSNIANAITYAADHGIRIISISMAGSSPSSVLQSAVDYAWSKGSVVIAAAGNSATSAPYYPAACNNVVAVSATDSGDALASFSNYGSYIDIAAPGTMIYTTNNGGGYGYWQGTSFSAPIVSAVAGLILSISPNMTNTDVVNTLLTNADDIGAPGFDTSFGWGRVNAYKAARAANLFGVTDTVPPTVVVSNPANSSTVSGGIYVQGTASDNIGVTKIEMYVDGVLAGTVSTSPYSLYWNTGTVTNGIHTLKLKAYDAAGNSGSSTVSVTTNNMFVHTAAAAPKVTIKSLTNGSRVTGNTKIVISAFTSVGAAPPTQVTLYIDDVAVYTATAGPFSFVWNTDRIPAGGHTIVAKAWGDGGSVGTSATVTVYK